jgi:vesicle coat complex subunit
VFQDIFRKYPSTYEGVIPTLCANLDELDEPEAKASLIWIIGEYANKIDNADELLSIFVESFTEESYPVWFVYVRSSQVLTVGETGATADVIGSREVVPEETRLIAGDRTACTQHCDKRL